MKPDPLPSANDDSSKESALSPATVLLVDDQAVNLRALTTLLKNDYRLQALTDGSKALEVACGDHPPDLILLDIQMPGMDGYEVCRRLKADVQTREIPVIFITARDATDDEERGLALGAADYITKPFSPGVVKARVRYQIERKQAQDALSSTVAELRRALSEIKTLRGMVPICAWCKKIREDEGYWLQVEEYLEAHSDASFTHGICPECFEKHTPRNADPKE